MKFGTCIQRLQRELVRLVLAVRYEKLRAALVAEKCSTCGYRITDEWYYASRTGERSHLICNPKQDADLASVQRPPRVTDRTHGSDS